MYSEIVNGKVLDYRFVKRGSDSAFYLGDIFIGQIFWTGRAYSAVSHYENPYGTISGFKTRLDAANYLLAVFRKHMNTPSLNERIGLFLESNGVELD